MKFLLGLLTGAATAVAYDAGVFDTALLEFESRWRQVEVGVPAVSTLTPEDTRGIYEPVVSGVPVVEDDQLNVADNEATGIPVPSSEPVSDALMQSDTQSDTNQRVPESILADQSPAREVSLSATPIDDPDNLREDRAFQVAWMPFRSEASARGFAEQLSRQLGVDMQIHKSGPGHYEVGFEYDSVSERELRLQQLEAITGFRVAGGS